ncbi:MAG: ABC transporter permease [Bacteroidales bacterium]|nr:ABC transporter permease [Bacteroidales bacterium]
MFDSDRWREIISSLAKNKIRTIVTAFGVFWGILMLVIMLGSGKGLQNGMFYILGDFATNSLFIWTQPTTEPYKGFPKNRQWFFNNDDTKAIRENITEIEVVTPRVQAPTGNQLVVYKKNTGSFAINGDYPETNRLDPVTILEGRFINYLDLIEKRKVVVIGQRVKEQLFGPEESPLGKYIQISGMYFQVVGVFKSKHTQDWGRSQNESIFMPFTTLQKAYNLGNIVFYYGIMVKPQYHVADVEKKVRRLLASRHNVSPNDYMAFGSQNIEEQFKQMNGVFIGIRFLTWFVGILTLFAGVVGVSNIMLVIIRERTKEIGIQRALGATPLHILTQIILESILLTFLAGLIGMAIGIGIIQGVDTILKHTVNPENAYFLNPEVDIRAVLSAFVLLVVAGAFAGSLPAWHAIRIKPVDAIRTEI